MENPMHRSLIVVALLLLAPLANAQVYKWTDASGTVHYSEAPPAKGTSYNKVTTTGTVKPLVAPKPETAKNDAEIVAKPAAKEVADTPENRTKLCSSLQTNLSALQGSGPVVMQQGGKTMPLDADQRKQQLAAAKSQFDQYCETR
jgi:hypothetical protein